MNRDANIIGKKIARLRYNLGLTQEMLAARLQVLQCDISRDVVANIENKRSAATDKHCFFLAKVLGVSINELFRP